MSTFKPSILLSYFLIGMVCITMRHFVDGKLSPVYENRADVSEKLVDLGHEHSDTTGKLSPSILRMIINRGGPQGSIKEEKIKTSTEGSHMNNVRRMESYTGLLPVEEEVSKKTLTPTTRARTTFFRVYVKSIQGKISYKSFPGMITGVEVVKQISSAPCVAGFHYAYLFNYLIVIKGCHACFLVRVIVW